MSNDNSKYKYIFPKPYVFNQSIEMEQVLALICEHNGSKYFCPNGHSKKQKIQIYRKSETVIRPLLYMHRSLRKSDSNLWS